MRYSDEIIEEVRSKNDIVEVISGYVKLQKKGSSYFGLCPFHNEKSASFSVSGGKQLFYCFGCGEGGNVISFLMKYENYSFQEAVEHLANRSGIVLPKREYSAEDKRRQDEKATLLEINKAAAYYYCAQLRKESGKVAYNYLKGRKLSDETINKFGLGYSNKYRDDLYRYLKSKGYEDSMIIRAGLAGMDEKEGVYDKFWNRVMFPIMDKNNRVIAFGGRVMGDAKPKYLNSPESEIFEKRENLYGLHLARRTKKPYFLLCEGYMDVIAMHQAGFDSAVASLGTALTPGHASLIKRYVKEVYLTYDSDEAGTKAALRAIPILREAGITARVIRMEPYKDPDEFIKNLGPQEFEKRIEQARNGFMFSVAQLASRYQLRTPDGRTQFSREVAKLLVQFEEKIERDSYTQAVAEEYHFNFEDLKELVKKQVIQQENIKTYEVARENRKKEAKKDAGIMYTQQLLLTWMIEDQAVFEKVKRYVSVDDFTGEIYQKVAELLFEQYEKNHTVNPAQVMNHFQDEEEHKEVSRLFYTQMENLTGVQEKETTLKELMIKMKSYSLGEALKKTAMGDPLGLQKQIEAKKAIEALRREKISLT